MERSAMDSSSKEYSWLSLTVAFALLFVWGVISLALAYDRRLADVNESFTGAFRVAGRLDVIANALDHLGVDQQAFLSTGEERFQDGVIESIQTLELSINSLNSLAARRTSHRALLLALSRLIERVIAMVAESDRIREAGNKAAAAAFFESKEAEISQAKSQTAQLRLETIVSISDRIRGARGSETLVAALVDDARRWQHVWFLNSARQLQRTGAARHTGSPT
jgi:CHASE3 domain sensor protein